MKVFSKGGFLGLAGVRSVISLPTRVIYFLIKKNFILLIPVWAFTLM